MKDKQETGQPPKRDSLGRLMPGSTANTHGRPKLPDWFKAKGEKALAYLADVACGDEEVEKQEHRIRAAEWVAGRCFGRPKITDDEETNDANATLAAIVAALVKRDAEKP